MGVNVWSSNSIKTIEFETQRSECDEFCESTPASQ